MIGIFFSSTVLTASWVKNRFFYSITLEKQDMISKSKILISTHHGIFSQDVEYFVFVDKMEKNTEDPSLYNKLKYSNHNTFATWQWNKPLIFQTLIFLSNRIHNLKYPRCTTLDCKDKGFRKSEYVARTQFLSGKINRIKVGSTEFLNIPHSN